MTTPETNLTARLRDYAAAAGADLVGIASIDRFDGVPPEHHPRSIFPEAKSVIAVAKRITRGCLRGAEEGTQFTGVNTYAMNWLPNRFLAEITVSVASFLEDQRHEAVPLPDLPPETPPMGISAKDGAPAPNVMVDFAEASVRCGLGTIGLTGLLMTPEFGPLQRVQLILTDAELEASPLCEQAVCDQCGACAAACPLDAIHTDRTTTRSVCGMDMPVAEIDKNLCLHCPNGAYPNPSHPSGQPERIGALCMRTCVAHLDADKRLTRQFANPFRKRPAWYIDRTGQPALMEE